MVPLIPGIIKIMMLRHLRCITETSTTTQLAKGFKVQTSLIEELQTPTYQLIMHYASHNTMYSCLLWPTTPLMILYALLKATLHHSLANWEFKHITTKVSHQGSYCPHPC